MQKITNPERAAVAYVRNTDPAKSDQLHENLRFYLPPKAWHDGAYQRLVASHDAKERANTEEATAIAQKQAEKMEAERIEAEAEKDSRRKKADRLMQMLTDAGVNVGDSVKLSPAITLWRRDQYAMTKLIGREGEYVMVEGKNGPMPLCDLDIHPDYRRV